MVAVSWLAAHSGSKWLKPAENKFTLYVISRIFPSKFQHLHIITFSGHFIHLMFKICQTVVGICMINQFHEFFSLIFGGFLQFRTCVGRLVM